MVVVGVAGLGRGGGGLLRDWGWMSSVMGFEDDGNTYPGLGRPSCHSQIRHDIGIDVIAAIVVACHPALVHCRGTGKPAGICTRGTMGRGTGTLFLTRKKPVPLAGYPRVFYHIRKFYK